VIVNTKWVRTIVYQYQSCSCKEMTNKDRLQNKS